MTDNEIINEYLKKGGAITKCPDHVCAWGYSPHTPDHALGDTSKGDLYSDTIGKYHKILRRHTLKGLEQSRKAPRVNARLAAIYAELRQLWMDTPDDPKARWELICDQAAKAKISTSASRDRFIKAGVDVGSFKNISAMTRGEDLPQDKVDEIIRLRKSGLACEKIGPMVGVGKGVVFRVLNQVGEYKPLREKTKEEKEILQRAVDEIIKSGRNTWTATARKHGVSEPTLRSAVGRIQGIR